MSKGTILASRGKHALNVQHMVSSHCGRKLVRECLHVINQRSNLVRGRMLNRPLKDFGSNNCHILRLRSFQALQSLMLRLLLLLVRSSVEDLFPFLLTILFLHRGHDFASMAPKILTFRHLAPHLHRLRRRCSGSSRVRGRIPVGVWLIRLVWPIGLGVMPATPAMWTITTAGTHTCGITHWHCGRIIHCATIPRGSAEKLFVHGCRMFTIH